MNVTVTGLSPAALRAQLDDGGEIAVLDVREEGVFARDGHLLLASNVPLSHLELRMPALVPRRSTRVVVCDGGEGFAMQAAAKLVAWGYAAVHVLDGGTPAWAGAGERLYTGVYVPSKAFGEYVHHHDRPPEVTADELAAWKRDGRELVILDSRPMDEYRRNTIPGSIDCPSAELPYRVHDMIRSPATTVVVNCGGRTRAIIGAQALINAGLSNPVFALRNGTQGWHLAGHALARGATDHAPAPGARGREAAQAAAQRLIDRYRLQTIDHAALVGLRADPARTTCLLDVRTQPEFEAGHLPGSLHAPGGQLVQATDTWLAVRRARVVLVDDQAVRAAITASWLVQMGWDEVYLLERPLDGQSLERGPCEPEVIGLAQAPAATVTPQSLSASIAAGSVEVVDFDLSLGHRDGHVPGAWHVVRSRLADGLARVPGTKPLVFTSPDGVLARLAAGDARALTDRPVEVLAGGTAAWVAAGLPLETGDARLTGPADDMKYRALDQKQGVEAAIREYLTWEVDLLEAVEVDRDFRFRRFDAH